MYSQQVIGPTQNYLNTYAAYKIFMNSSFIQVFYFHRFVFFGNKNV